MLQHLGGGNLGEDELLVIEEEQNDVVTDRMPNQSKLSNCRTDLSGSSASRYVDGGRSKLTNVQKEMAQQSLLEEHRASNMANFSESE